MLIRMKHWISASQQQQQPSCTRASDLQHGSCGRRDLLPPPRRTLAARQLEAWLPNLSKSLSSEQPRLLFSDMLCLLNYPCESQASLHWLHPAEPAAAMCCHSSAATTAVCRVSVSRHADTDDSDWISPAIPCSPRAMLFHAWCHFLCGWHGRGVCMYMSWRHCYSRLQM